MRALVLRGKHKGKTYVVSQWCNDWFMLDAEDMEIARSPFSPSSLAFTMNDMLEIAAHKNNGTLFEEYEPRFVEATQSNKNYTTSFKRRKYAEQT